MTVALVILGIAVLCVALAVGFALGVRYSATKMMPVWLSRMNQQELSELAARADRERRDAADA